MPAPVALSVRFPDARSLAAGWDLSSGRIALPVELPPAGTFVLVDGRAGDVAFLLGGAVHEDEEGRRWLQLPPERRALIEALIEPSVRRGAGGPRAVA